MSQGIYYNKITAFIVSHVASKVNANLGDGALSKICSCVTKNPPPNPLKRGDCCWFWATPSISENSINYFWIFRLISCFSRWRNHQFTPTAQVPIINTRGVQMFQKYGSQLRLLGTSTATWSKFRSECAHILGATGQNLSPWRPGTSDLCIPNQHRNF